MARKKWKRGKKRRKIENGRKSSKMRRGPFFFFFFLFKTAKTCFGCTKMEIFYREKSISRREKITKNDFAPSEKITSDQCLIIKWKLREWHTHFLLMIMGGTRIYVHMCSCCWEYKNQSWNQMSSAAAPWSNVSQSFWSCWQVCLLLQIQHCTRMKKEMWHDQGEWVGCREYGF